MNRLMLAVVFFLFSTTSWAIQDANIRVSLEEPSSASIASGISNLRGWAVAPSGIDHVELFVNGIYVDDIPYGGLRTDVGAAFPSHPDSNNSGYSMAWAYSSLAIGTNHMTIIAYDKLGNFNIDETEFQVEKFVSSFISDPNQINLSTAENIRVIDSNRLIMEGVVVEGENWDVELKWQTATQGFDIARIDSATATSMYMLGTWEGRIAWTTGVCSDSSLTLKILEDSWSDEIPVPDDLYVDSLTIIGDDGSIFAVTSLKYYLDLDPFDDGYMAGRVFVSGGESYTFVGSLHPNGEGDGVVQNRDGSCTGTWEVAEQ